MRISALCIQKDIFPTPFSLCLSNAEETKRSGEFGRYHNTEVTFCASVNAVLFFSHCPIQSQNEIKTMLQVKDAACGERKRAYL